MDYGLTVKTAVNRVVPKKLFYEKAEYTKKDKDFFNKTIDKVTWLNSLKYSNINIEPYKDDEKEFEEIEIIKVVIKDDVNIKKAAEMIMKAIPYPMLIEFSFEDKRAFAVEKQRINKVDTDKNIIEEIIITEMLSKNDEFFQKLNFKNFRNTNFYLMYLDLYNLIALKIADELGINNVESAEEARDLSEEIISIETEIEKLRNKLKKEKQFNKKMEINIEIKKLQEKIKAIKNRGN